MLFAAIKFWLYKVLPQREIGLIKSARLRMIHSSTAIEGNLLNLKEVEAVLAGKTQLRRSATDIAEVLNYEKVLRFIDTLDNQPKIKLGQDGFKTSPVNYR